MDPKRFSIIVITISSVAFATIGSINWIVNPYAQYAPAVLAPLVQTSRAKKVKLLSTMTPAPAGLVLGSSRVLKLEPQYLESKFRMRFFNAGVNHGKPEDHLAMLRYYHGQFGTYPRLVVLGLDVHGFSGALPCDSRLLSNPALVRHVSDAIPLAARLHRWKELLSWQQAIASAKSLRRHLRGHAVPLSTESFQDDGLLMYHVRERQMEQGIYDFEAALAYNKREYKQLFAKFDRLSPRRIALFRTLVNTCVQHDTQLVVFLTPLHPTLHEYLGATSYPQRRVELTEFLSGHAAAMRFTFSDCSEIDHFDGDATNFIDGIHPLEPNTRRIIDRLTQQTKPAAHYVIQ